MLDAAFPQRNALYRRHVVRETLDRLQSCAELDGGRTGRKVWRSIVELTDRELTEIKALRVDVSPKTLERVAAHFGVSEESILSGGIDFHEIAVRMGTRQGLPERYQKGAFSRRRTPITSLEFVEKIAGWRTRRRVLRHFRTGEAQFTDPMGLISHRFISDFCLYLRSNEGFGSEHYFQIGTYSLAGNQNTLISETFSRLSGPSELYEKLFTEMMKFFEYNCCYKLLESTPDSCVVDAIPYQDVLEAMGVKLLGNPSVCDLKTGMLASMTGYLGLPYARVEHTHCAHRGDSVCRYRIIYPRRVSGDAGRN